MRADFGDDQQLGTVEGEVNSFKVGPSGKLMNWALNLEKACIGGGCPSSFEKMFAPPGPAVPDNAFRGNTSGFADGHAIDGRWSGRFYGNDETPGSIAGTFGAAMAESTGEASGGYRLDLLSAFGAHHR